MEKNIEKALNDICASYQKSINNHIKNHFCSLHINIYLLFFHRLIRHQTHNGPRYLSDFQVHFTNLNCYFSLRFSSAFGMYMRNNQNTEFLSLQYKKLKTKNCIILIWKRPKNYLHNKSICKVEKPVCCVFVANFALLSDISSNRF